MHLRVASGRERQAENSQAAREGRLLRRQPAGRGVGRSQRTALSTWRFPLNTFWGVFVLFFFLSLSLPLPITEPVPWEAEWHPGKDDYNGRVSPCPRRWVIIQITLGRLQKRRDRAVAIPVSSARKCVCLRVLCVNVYACVCVCLFQSPPRSRKTPVQSDKPAAAATPRDSATGAKFRADWAPRPLPRALSLSLSLTTTSLFPGLQGTELPLLWASPSLCPGR